MEAKNELQKYELSDPEKTLELAKILSEYIEKQKLFSIIQGKKYINVEGWQFAGGQLGIVPVLESLITLNTADEIKYRAETNLIRLDNGMVVGRGIAICSNKESTKKTFAEYAIASMAQTRSIGKAYRNLLAWLIKAAGYEATPSEEMDEVKKETPKKAEPNKEQTAKQPETKKPEAKPAKPKTLSGAVANCKEKKELDKLWDELSSEKQSEKRISDLFENRAKELIKESEVQNGSK